MIFFFWWRTFAREYVILIVGIHFLLVLFNSQTIDASLLTAIKKVDNLGRYLKSTWGLSKGDRIHELKF